MGMKLASWVGRPQPHIVGLFLSLMAVLAIVAFMIATLEYNKTRGRLLLTAFLVGGYFLTMLAAASIPREGWGPMVRHPAMLASTVAILLMVFGLWGTLDSNEFWKATAAVTVIAMGLTAAGQTLSRAEGGTAVRVTVIFSAALSAALMFMSVLAIVLEIGVAAFWWAFALLAVGWIVAALTLLALRMRRRKTGG